MYMAYGKNIMQPSCLRRNNVLEKTPGKKKIQHFAPLKKLRVYLSLCLLQAIQALKPESIFQ